MFQNKMKKGFGILEIIMSIIIMGIITEVILSISQQNKINSISLYNLDKQIELENETNESRKVCARLKSSSCNSLPNGIESVGKCNFSYEYEDTLGELSTVNGTCEVLSSVSFRTNISISYTDKSDNSTITKSSKGVVYVSK